MFINESERSMSQIRTDIQQLNINTSFIFISVPVGVG